MRPRIIFMRGSPSVSHQCCSDVSCGWRSPLWSSHNLNFSLEGLTPPVPPLFRDTTALIKWANHLKWRMTNAFPVRHRGVVDVCYTEKWEWTCLSFKVVIQCVIVRFCSGDTVLTATEASGALKPAFWLLLLLTAFCKKPYVSTLCQGSYDIVNVVTEKLHLRKNIHQTALQNPL